MTKAMCLQPKRHITAIIFGEFETAKKIAAHLEGLGMEVQTGIAHTGVVGILKGLAIRFSSPLNILDQVEVEVDEGTHTIFQVELAPK